MTLHIEDDHDAEILFELFAELNQSRTVALEQIWKLAELCETVSRPDSAAALRRVAKRHEAIRPQRAG